MTPPEPAAAVPARAILHTDHAALDAPGAGRDTAAAGQDDRPAAGGDVDMVDQGAATPDPPEHALASDSHLSTRSSCSRTQPPA